MGNSQPKAFLDTPKREKRVTRRVNQFYTVAAAEMQVSELASMISAGFVTEADWKNVCANPATASVTCLQGWRAHMEDAIDVDLHPRMGKAAEPLPNDPRVSGLASASTSYHFGAQSPPCICFTLASYVPGRRLPANIPSSASSMATRAINAAGEWNGVIAMHTIKLTLRCTF